MFVNTPLFIMLLTISEKYGNIKLMTIYFSGGTMKNISLSIPNTEKSSRNYGIDMLRIISMIMVIILHIITKSNFLKMPQSISVKNETVTILRMLCFCAVNVYAIISGFVGYIKSSHKYSSLIHLWAQVFFYYFMFFKIRIYFVQIIKNYSCHRNTKSCFNIHNCIIARDSFPKKI